MVNIILPFIDSGGALLQALQQRYFAGIGMLGPAVSRQSALPAAPADLYGLRCAAQAAL
jgi:hypothetical protein